MKENEHNTEFYIFDLLRGFLWSDLDEHRGGTQHDASPDLSIHPRNPYFDKNTFTIPRTIPKKLPRNISHVLYQEILFQMVRFSLVWKVLVVVLVVLVVVWVVLGGGFFFAPVAAVALPLLLAALNHSQDHQNHHQDRTNQG